MLLVIQIPRLLQMLIKFISYERLKLEKEIIMRVNDYLYEQEQKRIYSINLFLEFSSEISMGLLEKGIILKIPQRGDFMYIEDDLRATFSDLRFLKNQLGNKEFLCLFAKNSCLRLKIESISKDDDNLINYIRGIHFYDRHIRDGIGFVDFMREFDMVSNIRRIVRKKSFSELRIEYI